MHLFGSAGGAYSGNMRSNYEATGLGQRAARWGAPLSWTGMVRPGRAPEAGRRSMAFKRARVLQMRADSWDAAAWLAIGLASAIVIVISFWY